VFSLPWEKDGEEKALWQGKGLLLFYVGVFGVSKRASWRAEQLKGNPLLRGGGA
jgi:hypothetical protein